MFGQAFAAFGVEVECGHGFAVAEVLFDIDQAAGVEAARVGGKIAIRQAGHLAKLDKFLAVFNSQGGKDAKPSWIGDKGIEGH